MYRPQFAYSTPEGCEDQRCHYSFDGSNTPTLRGNNLAAGTFLFGIPLPMDNDADFYLRGFQLEPSGLMLRLEDPHDNPLSDSGNLVPAAGTQFDNYEHPALYGEPDGAGIVTLESDEWGVFCPRGGRFLLHVFNPTAAPIALATIIVNLHGVKRYSGEKCR